MYFIFINKWISLCVGIIFNVVTDGRLIQIMQILLSSQKLPFESLLTILCLCGLLFHNFVENCLCK